MFDSDFAKGTCGFRSCILLTSSLLLSLPLLRTISSLDTQIFNCEKFAVAQSGLKPR